MLLTLGADTRYWMIDTSGLDDGPVRTALPGGSDFVCDFLMIVFLRQQEWWKWSGFKVWVELTCWSKLFRLQGFSK